MNQVIFLILRRMRAPLIVLIIAYAISILGLVLIPGVDNDGNPWRMDFFHAFYFVSYMATTIGFGEIPYPFTDGQRLWTLIAVYLTVIAWLYAIGKILTLIQDRNFRQAVIEQSFTRSVKLIRENFYIICGYGDTGRILVQAMDQRDIRAVVLDNNQQCISTLEMAGLHNYIPALCADARRGEVLIEAGLRNRFCVGIIALSNDDKVNLKVAITAKLLRPKLQVICRVETRDAGDNMASFGTDHILNPFEIFSNRLALAIHSPSSHLLYEWLTAVPDTPLPEPLYPPHGTWVLCGFGRFGTAVRNNLLEEGIETVVVEAMPEITGHHDVIDVVGRGTEATTLHDARIEHAAGIVAGTDNDTNNLSIVMTARDLNPELFMVARQNREDNNDIFEAARLDLVMHRSDLLARSIFSQITTPMLNDFLYQTRFKDNDWANHLISRISAVTDETVPLSWVVKVRWVTAPALLEAMDDGEEIVIEDLLRLPSNREKHLACIPLSMQRDGGLVILPSEGVALQQGDELLFCGSAAAEESMRWTLFNRNVLRYVCRGETRYEGYLWGGLARLVKKRQL